MQTKRADNHESVWLRVLAWTAWALCFLPTAGLLVAWVLYRYTAWVNSGLVERWFALAVLGEPLCGLLFLALLRWRFSNGSQTNQILYKRIFRLSGLAVASPLWLIPVFLLLTGVNR